MSDSDGDDKKKNVPSWQSKDDQQSTTDDEKTASEPQSREELLAQAKKFLEDDEVKDASTNTKIAFLKSKGVGREDIEELLGVWRNDEASSASPTETSYTPPLPQPSQTSQQAHIQAQPSISSQPPIITYPEFLTTPTSPSPLITKPRLLTTLYAFSALSLLLYGTSTYLVKPMIESLTTSRLSLSSTAKTNLEKLIDKLEKVVSTIPTSTQQAKAKEEEEEESEDEDPTELFHRDIGIQTTSSLSTSPPLSPTPSIQSDPLITQTSRLTSFQKSLASLVSYSNNEKTVTLELESKIEVLTGYLEGLAYIAPSYGYGSDYARGGSGVKDADDEIAKVKAGIRSVKGVLLSARSFPGGVRGSVR